MFEKFKFTRGQEKDPLSSLTPVEKKAETSLPKVHSMPEKFQAGPPRDTGRNPWLWGVVIFLVFAVLVLGAVFLFNRLIPKSENGPPVISNQNTNLNKNGNVNLNTNQNGNENQNLNENANLNVNQNLNVNRNVNVNDNQNINLNPLPSSSDKDNDSLTDEEENHYSTEIDKPDSDGDGYLDGEEVLNHYSPIGSGTLLASGLIDEYTNTVFDYTIIFPASWEFTSINEQTGKQVIFTNTTSEYVEIVEQENAESLSSLEWYLNEFPDVSSSLLEKVTMAGLPAILSPDEQTVYLASGKKIFIIDYKSDTRATLNFKTTFRLMWSSFEFSSENEEDTNLNVNSNENSNLNQNQNTNQNTNTNANSNSNSNLNTNTNSNSNSNTNLSSY